MSTVTRDPARVPPVPARQLPTAPLREQVLGVSPRPFPLVRHSLALAGRSLIKTWRTPEALIDVTLQPAIFLVIFVYIFGGAVAGSTHDYLQFLLPGILGQTIAQAAIMIGVNLNTDLEKGIFDRFRSLPIWRPAVLVGMLLADTVRYTMASLVVITLGVILGFRPEGGVIGVVLAVALLLVFSFSLSWVWTSIGMRMQTPETVMQMSMTVLFPLTFASNVFVDPSTMPAVAGPAPGGVTFVQARKLIHGLVRKGRVVGMDIVEIQPAKDDANQISCITAGRLILNLIGASIRAGHFDK